MNTTSPGPPDQWQLSAELKPKPTAAGTGGADDELNLTPPAWATGSEGLRSTVKWMVAALAAIGGVLFAKGLVTVPTLSWKEDWIQLVAAAVCGTASLLAIGWLLLLAVDLVRPTVYALTRLPDGYEGEIANDVRGHLPSDCTNFEEYKGKLDDVLTATAGLRANRDRKRTQLDIAKDRFPAKAPEVHQAQADLAVAERDYQFSKSRLAVYAKTRETILARAEYWSEATLFTRKRTGMVIAAVVAAAGGILYQLALATPKDAEEDNGDGLSASPAVVGTLTRLDNEAGQQLWKALRLADCQTNPATASVPVVISSGTGTPDDQYVVTTLASTKCVPQTFRVISDAATVVKNEALVTITYTPSPDPEDD